MKRDIPAMKKLAILAVIFGLTISGEVTAGDLSPFLSKRLSQSSRQEKITAIIRLKEKADLRAYHSRKKAFRALRAMAQESGRTMRPFFQGKNLEGKLTV